MRNVIILLYLIMTSCTAPLEHSAHIEKESHVAIVTWKPTDKAIDVAQIFVNNTLVVGAELPYGEILSDRYKKEASAGLDALLGHLCALRDIHTIRLYVPAYGRSYPPIGGTPGIMVFGTPMPVPLVLREDIHRRFRDFIMERNWKVELVWERGWSGKSN